MTYSWSTDLEVQIIKFKKKSFIFLLSIAVSILAFMIANERDVPLVSNLVFRKVNLLKTGFNDVCGLPIKVKARNDRSYELIKGDLSLNPDEDGFTELSEFLIKDLKRSEPKFVEKIPYGSKDTAVSFKGKAISDGFSRIGYSGIPGNLHGINVPHGNNSIRVFLNDSETGHDYIEYYVYFVKEEIDTEYRKTAFNWAFIILLFAISIQVVEFLLL